MATNSQQNSENQEIDLSYLSKKTAHFIDRLGYMIYKFFRFLVKNIIILSILIVVGAIAGFIYENKSEKSYKQEIIVIPNFGSLSYLYGEIENMEFEEGPISSVEIKPIVDIYQFINEGYNNLEIAKYLSENNIEIKKYEQGSDVEKFYKYHLITLNTKGEDVNRKIVNDFLANLNKEKYFLERQKIEQQNIQKEMAETDSSISEVNNILQKISSPTLNSSDMNIEMYAELNELISGKKNLIRDLGKLNIQKLEQTKVIYDAAVFPNIKDNGFPKIILFPIILFALFLIGALIKMLFVNYKSKEFKSLEN